MSNERVIYGSDYPFPLGEQRMGEGVRNNPWLSKSDKEKILGGNAVKFLGMGGNLQPE